MDTNYDYAAYLPALRSMASLSQLPQPLRPTRRSPNSTLSRRSRVMKPASTQNSPSRGPPRNRTALAARMTRPATFHAATGYQPQQAPGFSQAQGYDYNSNGIPNSRPVTWHPAFQASMFNQYPTMYAQFQAPQQAWREPAYDASALSGMHPGNTNVPANYSGVMPMQYPTYGSSWFDPSPTQGFVDGNNLPINNLNLNQGSSSSQIQPTSFYNDSQQDMAVAGHSATYQQQHHQQASLYDQSSGFSGIVTDEEGDELVGMGLHDESTNYEQPSLLLGAGLDEHEKPSQRSSGLSALTSEWSPPEQVPDAIPDEGNDTPVTNDFNDWSSPVEQLAITPREVPQPMYYNGQYNTWVPPQHQHDLSGQSFLFDEATDTPQDQYYDLQQKQVAMSMNEWGWM